MVFWIGWRARRSEENRLCESLNEKLIGIRVDEVEYDSLDQCDDVGRDWDSFQRVDLLIWYACC